MRLHFFLLIFSLIPSIQFSQEIIIPGACRTEIYLDQLKGKRVALVGNHTSMIGEVHLLDTLLESGIQVIRIFSPEHGFRGNVDAGESVMNAKDRKTGIPVISLYGKHVKPLARDLHGLDLLLFDIQDVGVRFYTYLSTLHYIMEACAEQGLPLILLDRPNPIGFYVDGPVLEKKYSSFVGLHPVPVVYGMTIGEYARMLNGEGWLHDGIHCKLTVIPCLNYTHSSRYILPQKPSPNLPGILSIYLYPSLAFFEGTSVSIGRGTLFPFAVYGSPHILNGPFEFIPEKIPGMSENPPYDGQICRGWDLRQTDSVENINSGKLNLSYLINAYSHSSDKDNFFNSYFNLLAGNENLKKQIIAGVPEEEIRLGWEPRLSAFRQIRKKYLIYKE